MKVNWEKPTIRPATTLTAFLILDEKWVLLKNAFLKAVFPNGF